MSRRAVIALLVALLAPAASAGAQSATNGGSFFAVGGVPGQTLISSTDIPATASGELIVTFRGDSASGCEAIGVCAYSGSVIIRPGSADVLVAKYKRDARIAYDGSLDLGFGLPSVQAITFARVERQGSGGVQGVCADVQQPTNAVQLKIGGGVVTGRVLAPGGGLLATRCAGPLDGDLARAGPSISVSLARLLKGRTQLPLSGSWTFAAHGFAGTVTSTIVLRLGQPQTTTPSSSTNSFPPGIKTAQVRIVTEQLALVRGRGSVTALIKGATDATECSLLDSCGLSGSLVLTPNYTGTVGSLTATGPESLPYRDFLAALGLSQHGRPSGIQVEGSVAWDGEGTVTSSLTQSGSSCLDSAPLGPGLLGLSRHGKQLDAVYTPATAARTQCPGPMLSQNDRLSEGSLSVSALGRQTFSVNLTRGQSFSDDGYAGKTSGHLKLTLRRGRITQQIVTQPAD